MTPEETCPHRRPVRPHACRGRPAARRGEAEALIARGSAMPRTRSIPSPRPCWCRSMRQQAAARIQELEDQAKAAAAAAAAPQSSGSFLGNLLGGGRSTSVPTAGARPAGAARPAPQWACRRAINSRPPATASPQGYGQPQPLRPWGQNYGQQGYGQQPMPQRGGMFGGGGGGGGFLSGAADHGGGVSPVARAVRRHQGPDVRGHLAHRQQAASALEAPAAAVGDWHERRRKPLAARRPGRRPMPACWTNGKQRLGCRLRSQLPTPPASMTAATGGATAATTPAGPESDVSSHRAVTLPLQGRAFP